LKIILHGGTNEKRKCVVWCFGVGSASFHHWANFLLVEEGKEKRKEAILAYAAPDVSQRLTKKKGNIKKKNKIVPVRNELSFKEGKKEEKKGETSWRLFPAAHRGRGERDLYVGDRREGGKKLPAGIS